MAHAVTAQTSYPSCMQTPEIASFIQRLMRRELGDGELSALTTRDLDDINTYLAERAKASRAAQHSTRYNAEAGVKPGLKPSVEQRVKTIQGGLQAFKTARTYSEREILLELGVLE